MLCKMTGGFWQCVADCSCQCLRRPDFFCMPKRNRGKKTAAGGGLFTRRPPPAPLPPDPSACPASHLGGVYTTTAPAGCACSFLLWLSVHSNPLSHGFAVTAPVAVPEILCSQFAHRISSGLTLSICAARCLRKRKCLPSRFGRLPPPLAARPCGPLPLLFARLLFRVAAKPSRFASLAPRQAAAQLLRSFVSATGGSRSKPTGSARKRPPLPSRGAFFRCGGCRSVPSSFFGFSRF